MVLLGSSYDSLAPFKQEAVTALTCSNCCVTQIIANITFRERQLAEFIAVGVETLTKLLRARNLSNDREACSAAPLRQGCRPESVLGWVVKLGLQAPAVHNLHRCTAGTHLPALVSATIGASGASRDASTGCASQSCQGCTPKANV